MEKEFIPFNRPYVTGEEYIYIERAIQNSHLSGDGEYTKKCNAWLENQTGCKKALLTHSCTAALEMAAILADIQPGDEIIMPSYTFVSTANAFALRGGVPVFVDIREDTLNLNEQLIEAAITPKTRAIVPVHYAGVSCDMDSIMKIAQKHNLLVIEDAAQGVMSAYSGRPLGSIGHLGCFSFHETKNIISGEGGALLINDEKMIERAEIIREKGTNRNKFFRGQVDKYTWVDIGSSYLPSEITAAFLWAQMQEAKDITRRRLEIWEKYHRELELLENDNKARRPVVPSDCDHNAHMYYLLLPDIESRNNLISRLNEVQINTVFHYIPLHTSPAGARLGRSHGKLTITDDVSDRLLRLPLWPGLDQQQHRVIEEVLRSI